MSASAVGLGEGDHRELLQTTGMLSREQLIHLFNRFSQLTSLPDVKKRIADAVKDKQEAVAVTTAIQEEILLEMGIDPSFGIACLGEVNVFYENDRDLMIQFYGFFANTGHGNDVRLDIVEGSPTAICKNFNLELHLPKPREELACDEAELEPGEFRQKMLAQEVLQGQQLEMLKHMRKFHPDDQSAILDSLHQHMENAGFDNNAGFLTCEQIQEIVRRRITSAFPSQP